MPGAPPGPGDGVFKRPSVQAGRLPLVLEPSCKVVQLLGAAGGLREAKVFLRGRAEAGRRDGAVSEHCGLRGGTGSPKQHGLTQGQPGAADLCGGDLAL
jgi:hypothetical protein